jgi:hypothetical protein
VPPGFSTRFISASGVEFVVAERQRLGVANSKVHRLRCGCGAGEFNLIGRRVDGADLFGRAPVDQQLGESAGTAADVGPAQALWQMKPVQKDHAGGSAPAAHHLFVGLAVGEKALCLGHQVSP